MRAGKMEYILAGCSFPLNHVKRADYFYNYLQKFFLQRLLRITFYLLLFWRHLAISA